jgi:mRNA interferase MazF
MRRGEIVSVAAPGDYGKQRPAILIQADVLNEADPDSMILALVTGTLRDAPLLRLTIEPSSENGLQKPSQIMVDKL